MPRIRIQPLYPTLFTVISLLSMPGCLDEPGTRPEGEDEAGETLGEGSEGETDTDSSGEGSSTETSEESGEPDSDSETGSSCPPPPVAPELVDDPEVFCKPGFAFDASYRLCVDEAEGLALGPFPPAMVEACEACGGVDCEAGSWPADQARGLRGAASELPCWPGTTAHEDGLICVDDEHAWGPFLPAMVADCKAGGGGELTCESMRWARDFAENLLPSTLGGDWVWILPEDYGLRDDSGGGGAFSAPRLNNPGGHSGIDVLAPVGTPLLAPCAGPVFTGYDGGYGNYVQLSCPVPETLAPEQELWTSILFAHLDTLAVQSGQEVQPGQSIGTVGKTGNAGSASINPHVHFELAIHASLGAAQSESHASSNHSPNDAGDSFALSFQEHCLDVLEFESTTGPSMKGRRVDPFLMMSCLSSDKPALQMPSASLQSAWTPWSDHYAATEFNVDEGL